MDEEYHYVSWPGLWQGPTNDMHISNTMHSGHSCIKIEYILSRYVPTTELFV